MRRRYNPRVVPAIVLAAGESSRMGRSKAMLPYGNVSQTFVSRILQTLRAGGAAGAFVVGRHDDEVLRGEVEASGPFATFTVNPAPEHGQLSSLIAGLNAADRPGVSGVMVLPVDVPLVHASTIATLIATFSATRAPIVRAVHAHAHGHPAIFARSVFDELRRADPAQGAKAVLRAHDDRLVNVEVNDPGVLADVDAPEDYERLFGQRP